MHVHTNKYCTYKNWNCLTVRSSYSQRINVRCIWDNYKFDGWLRGGLLLLELRRQYEDLYPILFTKSYSTEHTAFSTDLPVIILYDSSSSTTLSGSMSIKYSQLQIKLYTLLAVFPYSSPTRAVPIHFHKHWEKNWKTISSSKDDIPTLLTRETSFVLDISWDLWLAIAQCLLSTRVHTPF